MLAGVIGMAFAQSPSVGLRLSGGTAVSADVFWHLPAGHRQVEIALGWEQNVRHVDQVLTVANMWQGEITDAFGWTLGVGGCLMWQIWQTRVNDRYLALGICAIAGVSYRLEHWPLTLHLDLRPRIAMLGPDANRWGHIAVGVSHAF